MRVQSRTARSDALTFFENGGVNNGLKNAPKPSANMFFIAGGVGGVIARTVTSPLDRIRIMQQTRK
jgi:hypothetical protein